MRSLVLVLATVAGCNQALGIGRPHEAMTDLAITADVANAFAGSTLTYDLVVKNLGPDDAYSPAVVDTLPAGVVFTRASANGWSCSEDQGVVTCTTTWLAAGASADLAIDVVAPAQPVTLVDTATISSASPDGDESNNSVTTTVGTTSSSDLTIALSTSIGSVSATAPYVYAISVANNGPSTAPDVTVSLTEVTSLGLVVTSATAPGWSCGGTPLTCTIAALAPGPAPNLAFDVSAPAEGGDLVAVASVTSAASDPVPANNTATAAITVIGSSDLAIAASGAPSPATASGTISYTLDVANLGPSTADQVAVAVSQPPGGSSLTFLSAAGSGWSCSLGAAIQCTRPSLAVGSVPIVVTARAPSTGGTVTIDADVSAATADPVVANDTASTTMPVDPSADLSIALTSSAGPFAPGDRVTYGVVVTNAGPSAAGSATVTDTLPAGATFVSASGTGWACSGGQTVICSTGGFGTTAPALSIQITAPSTPGTITNTATVSSTTPDPATANNTAMLQTSIGAVSSFVFSRTDIATGPQPMFVASADVNGDGSPDLAITTAGVPAMTPASVSVLLNTTAATTAPPTFSPATMYLANQEPGAIAFGDLNGDGRPDLVATTLSSFSVLLNTTVTNATTPSFASPVAFGASGGNALAIADINRDGVPDVIMVGGSSMSVYLNTTMANATTPTFSTNVDFPTGLVPFAVAVGDVNGDGAIDVVVANESSNTVSVFRNTTAAHATTPSFAARVDFVTGSGSSPDPYSVAIADIDGDGRSDLAVANAFQTVSTVSTFLDTTVASSTTITFAPKLDLATGSIPVCVAMGDLDNDGKPDLAVVDSNASSISLFQNETPQGATSPVFATRQDVSVGASPRYLVIQDFDSDGRLDLAVSNQGSDSVSILLAR